MRLTSDDSRGLGDCLDLRYPFHQPLRVEITALPWRPRSGKIAIPIGDNYLLRSCRASSQPWAGAKLTDLLGRRAERVAIEHLLAQAQAGRSGAVVIRGEAGIGKTAILEYTRDVAAVSGFRVEYSVGVESERQFAFAGLHQLCGPLLDHADPLPEPQQAALRVAFGLRGGDTPDRFLVGLATLNLLAEVAEDGPLL